MNQSYKILMLGLMLVMAGQSLYSAQNINQLPLAKYFYQQGKNIGDSLYLILNENAYWNALFKGNENMVKIALSKGMDVNASDHSDMTALMIAIERGHLEIVRLLLNNGADVNAVNIFGWTALMYAVWGGYLEIVKLLLDKGAQVDAATSNGWTALNIAAQRGHLEIVRLFLDRGFDVNAADNLGDTVLMYAAWGGHLEIVQFLLDKGANVNAVGSEGLTALMGAAEGGHLEIVQLLLGKGARVNAADRVGRIALIRAAEYGHLDVVRFLLDKGANVNAQDSTGNTALIAAAEHGHLGIVKLLLVHGADSTGVDFSSPEFESIAAVFRAQREHLNLDELPRPFQQILDAYHEFQAGRPQRLKELLGISGSGQNILMNMQQGKSSAQHRPYVARVEALLGVSRKDLEKVFKEECIAQLMYYLKTGKFADSREQAEMFLGWPQPALAKTAVDEMMPVEDPRPRALSSESEPTFDTPKAPLFGDINMPD